MMLILVFIGEIWVFVYFLNWYLYLKNLSIVVKLRVVFLEGKEKIEILFSV